jgi:hypothetical protein
MWFRKRSRRALERRGGGSTIDLTENGYFSFFSELLTSTE